MHWSIRVCFSGNSGQSPLARQSERGERSTFELTSSAWVLCQGELRT